MNQILEAVSVAIGALTLATLAFAAPFFVL